MTFNDIINISNKHEVYPGNVYYQIKNQTVNSTVFKQMKYIMSHYGNDDREEVITTSHSGVISQTLTYKGHIWKVTFTFNRKNKDPKGALSGYFTFKYQGSHGADSVMLENCY